MTTTEITRSAKASPLPKGDSPGGADISSGHFARDAQELGAAGEQDARPAICGTVPEDDSPGGPGILNGHVSDGIQGFVAVEDQNTRPATDQTAPIAASPGGTASLNRQPSTGTQCLSAVEGSASPQAMVVPSPMADAPAGEQHSRDQAPPGAHRVSVPAASIPSHSVDGPHRTRAGEEGRPAAKPASASIAESPLADPLLALAADVLSDLEKVRIANENRFRQLTRAETDSDGETRGFGLDETHPDVARLAALVGMLRTAEHQATLNLGRRMRAHPLGPWVRDTVGVGEKQGARLLAAIGDPYIRPEITREDGTVEPSRPRLVSELWAYAGYHVIPASHFSCGAQPQTAGGEQDGHPSQHPADSQVSAAGAAAKRRKGQHANWSATAKMRAFLIAESCIKQAQSPYRLVYDATRAKYAEAVHVLPCERCGPKGKPAQPGSPLSDGHKHARALRAVAKEVLRDLWRESKAIHEQRQRDAA